MKRTVLLALGLLIGCASTEPAGPEQAELRDLIAEARPGSTPDIHDVRCMFVPEEGSEWRCSYRERTSNGRWVRLETSVAISGQGWVLIDGVSDPDQMLPAL